MNKKMGRPSKYNNPETKANLQELVYLFKKENPSGIIRISDMVRFTSEIHTLYPDKYPAYNKDVWGEYGREFIESANEPIRTTIATGEDVAIELPNITDIVEKYGNNPTKLLEYSLPIEQMLHTVLSDRNASKEENKKLLIENESLKEQINNQKSLIKQYESFILTMSHDSYRKDFEGVLKNQISVNANERNKQALRNLDNLGSFLEQTMVGEANTNTSPKTSVLSHWREKRNK